MAMNPETNLMEMLQFSQHMKQDAMAPYKSLIPPISGLVRPDGTPVPDHWSTYAVDEEIVIKNYVWRVAHVGEKHLLLEPVGPVLVGEKAKP